MFEYFFEKEPTKLSTAYQVFSIIPGGEASHFTKGGFTRVNYNPRDVSELKLLFIVNYHFVAISCSAKTEDDCQAAAQLSLIIATELTSRINTYSVQFQYVFVVPRMD